MHSNLILKIHEDTKFLFPNKHRFLFKFQIKLNKQRVLYFSQFETTDSDVNKPYGLSANQSRPRANVKRKEEHSS